MIKNKKKQIDKELIKQIDQLISETGFYHAIELLLRMNLLTYSDYEQWRMGKHSTLCKLFKHKEVTILSLLEQASHYVNLLNMKPEPLKMQPWGKNETGELLLFCPSNKPLSQYLGIQFSRDSSIDQMDLFFDGQLANLIQDLKRALITRNIRIASEKLHDLYVSDPHHSFLPQAKALLDALIDALEEKKIIDPKKEMQFLLVTLNPLAEAALAGEKRDYMALFWHRLALAIDDKNYQESSDIRIHSENTTITSEALHSCFCYQQIPDWKAVINSIEQTPQYKQFPGLLNHLATAQYKSGHREAYIQSICEFCWKFPKISPCPAILEDLTLYSIWNDFSEFDEDKQRGLLHFPSWILLQESGFSHSIKAIANTPESFVILQKIILLELKEQQPAINLREQLKQINQTLLNSYLKSKK